MNSKLLCLIWYPFTQTSLFYYTKYLRDISFKSLNVPEILENNHIGKEILKLNKRNLQDR